jgi:hypothetical protein
MMRLKSLPSLFALTVEAPKFPIEHVLNAGIIKEGR